MHHDHGPAAESVVLLLGALFLFGSPVTLWWLKLTPPWYVIYLFWLAVLIVTALVARRWHRHDF